MTESARIPPALVEVRARLEEIDRSLVLLLAARLEAAALAIRIRTARGAKVSDRAQERRVLSRARLWADEAGLPPALAEAVLRAVIEAGKVRAEPARNRRRPFVTTPLDRSRTRGPGLSLSPSALPSAKHPQPIVSAG
jgi:chorismate mutase